MLYMIHCTVRKTGPEPGHGWFDFLAEAADAGAAKALLRAELDRLRASAEVFDGPAEVYVADVIELTAAPTRGIVGRFEGYDGDERMMVADLLPSGEAAGCALLEPVGDVPDEGVIVEPFAVFGPKGGC